MSIIGTRIRLIFTDDRYTKLKSGDIGTVIDVTKLPKELGGDKQIWVDGTRSNLAMIEGKDQFKVVESMKPRMVDEILEKIIELEQIQNWLREVLETKTRPSEIMKMRQALVSIMSFIDGLRYSLGEIKR
jgi:hypothetical protein